MTNRLYKIINSMPTLRFAENFNQDSENLKKKFEENSQNFFFASSEISCLPFLHTDLDVARMCFLLQISSSSGPGRELSQKPLSTNKQAHYCKFLRPAKFIEPDFLTCELTEQRMRKFPYKVQGGGVLQVIPIRSVPDINNTETNKC